MDIKTLAHEVFPYVVEMRRDFHMHPEPSFEEFRTTQRIAEELGKMGIACRLFEPTGLIGEIKGGKSGKCIALRADIDALTTQEKTGLPTFLIHDCSAGALAEKIYGARAGSWTTSSTSIS